MSSLHSMPGGNIEKNQNLIFFSLSAGVGPSLQGSSKGRGRTGPSSDLAGLEPDSHMLSLGLGQPQAYLRRPAFHLL